MNAHDVFSVFDQARGMADDAVITKALDEEWILVTNDKSFGEQVARQHVSHHGVVLLRLKDERAAAKIGVLDRLLKRYSDRLANAFVVVTESRVRFARARGGTQARGERD